MRKEKFTEVISYFIIRFDYTCIWTVFLTITKTIPKNFEKNTLYSLLTLVVFVYAIIGMSQFAYVQQICGIDHILNFETFINSFLLLFQVSTCEDWNKFLEPIILPEPECDRHIQNGNPNGMGNCGQSNVGIIYFGTFVFITWIIVINMYIAIILENFDVATRENAEPLTADDFEQFFEVWQKYDDNLTQLISYEELQLLLHQLDEPLHVPLPNRPFITHYQLAMTCDGKIHCLEVIIALIKKVLGDSIALDAMKQAMIQTFQLKCKTTTRYEPCMTTMDYARMDRAARIIQNAWLDFKQCERYKNPPAFSSSKHSTTSLSQSGDGRRRSRHYIGTAIMDKKKNKTRAKLKSVLTTPNLEKIGIDGNLFQSSGGFSFKLPLQNFRRSLDSLLMIGVNQEVKKPEPLTEISEIQTKKRLHAGKVKRKGQQKIQKKAIQDQLPGPLPVSQLDYSVPSPRSLPRRSSSTIRHKTRKKVDSLDPPESRHTVFGISHASSLQNVEQSSRLEERAKHEFVQSSEAINRFTE